MASFTARDCKSENVLNSNEKQGRSRLCGHAVMTAQSFGQFRPKEQHLKHFFQWCFLAW